MKKKMIIFDLDGTIYKLDGDSYQKSILKKKVINNAQKFIAAKLVLNKKDSLVIFNKIENKYGEKISIGIEKELGINRYDYFNYVWNISARNIVKKDKNIRKTLLLINKKYTLVLLSDAPKIWIKNVLKELNIQDIFKKNIFSGEGNVRKEFGNGYANIINKTKINPINCIAVGDQENSDIIPAKKIGIKTIFIHRTKKSKKSDINIKSFNEIIIALDKINNFD